MELKLLSRRRGRGFVPLLKTEASFKFSQNAIQERLWWHVESAARVSTYLVWSVIATELVNGTGSLWFTPLVSTCYAALM